MLCCSRPLWAIVVLLSLAVAVSPVFVAGFAGTGILPVHPFYSGSLFPLGQAPSREDGLLWHTVFSVELVAVAVSAVARNRKHMP